MINRYTTPEMAVIWSTETRIRLWIDVELAVTAAWENLGVVPIGVHRELSTICAALDMARFSERMAENEQVTKHDVIAFLTTLQEQVGDHGTYIHRGLTSSDVVDTAFGLAMRAAGKQLMFRIDVLLEALWACAEKYRTTLCLGRTHGQAAEATTFGLKILTYVAELDRDRRRLHRAIEEISHGKISGPVGNYGKLDPRVESQVMKSLGLRVEDISTQIVPRDRHAVYFSTLAIIAGFVDRFAVEIRHLMRSEVAEVFEPFTDGQQGSSAMPHKKNPILSENISGLARLVRSYASAAFENQVLWHERDISHSSVERVIAPDATTALDFALQRMTAIVEGLEVDQQQMTGNIDRANGFVMSATILQELIGRGMKRDEAYLLVQNASKCARQHRSSLQEELKKDPRVIRYLPADDCDNIFEKEREIRFLDLIFDRVKAVCAKSL